MKVTGLVAGEVLKHCEGSLHWTVVHQLQLDLLQVVLNAVAIGPVVLVLVVLLILRIIYKNSFFYF